MGTQVMMEWTKALTHPRGGKWRPQPPTSVKPFQRRRSLTGLPHCGSEAIRAIITAHLSFVAKNTRGLDEGGRGGGHSPGSEVEGRAKRKRVANFHRWKLKSPRCATLSSTPRSVNRRTTASRLRTLFLYEREGKFSTPE